MRDLTTPLAPAIALVVVGALALVLRWAFGRGGTVVARPARPGHEADYGLLVAIATPTSYVHAERLREPLDTADIRVTVAQTRDGLRLMVFAQDEQRARDLLRDTGSGSDP